MYNTTELLSLCFLFSSGVLLLVTFYWQLSLKHKEPISKALQFVVCIFIFHHLYVTIARMAWKDNLFIDYGAPFSLLYPPLALFATIIINGHNFSLAKAKWHFIPFIIFVLGYCYCLFHLNSKEIVSNYTTILYGLTALQWFIYGALIIVKIRSIFKNREIFTFVKRRFFIYILLTLGLFITLILVVLVQHRYFNVDMQASSYLVHFLMLMFSIILSWSVFDYHIQVIKEKSEQTVWHIPLEEKVILENCLTPEMEEEFEQIISTLEKLPLKTFSDLELNLSKMADQLAITPISLSQALNKKLQVNFNQFVNDKKCQIAVNYLMDPNFEGTMKDLAFISGFNSETTFYRSFKQNFKLTPLQYKNKNGN
ncbi:helix-turn-helix domain-containing protein [Aequorivita marina]|uniref:helix-turn-helix domain-containing protein n=1 Tax=Aequorivita marina TaxID=3073654 RepID=UPI0028752ACC|nr:helix-turn-helix domain-containing protein [Aequorivita sp. S2608]MDS1299084.1 helix-turn-helix domain-containing protein [Aequorivita sp. S2608]